MPDRLFNQWEAVSEWQLAQLVDLGMNPDHYLVDIGCGPGRLAVQAVPYLLPGRYYGVDPFPPYVRMARKVLQTSDVRNEYSITEGRAADCGNLPARFEYAMAASVFTHMSAVEIIECLMSLKTVMRGGGVMLFTYIERASRRGILYGGTAPMFYEKFDSKNLSAWADECRVLFEHFDVTHPTGQRVGLFRF